MFTFKTKAQNLQQLQGLHPDVEVPALFHFTRDEWLEDKRACVLTTQERLLGPVIIRSSAVGEDADHSSMAGAFDSLTIDDVTDHEALTTAVEAVIGSMISTRIETGRDRVLIQELVRDVAMSGVVFSRDLATGSPYIVINYDDISGSTDSVTAGRGADSGRTLWIFRDALHKIRSERFRQIARNFMWLESVTGSQRIDVEFAINREGRFQLLQVRPLSGLPSNPYQGEVVNHDLLTQIADFCEVRMAEQRGLLGRKSIFGQMPDWNPAEIIGRAPKRLARQIYESVITDNVWAAGRARIGYRDVSGYPLMVSLAGQPYIDVRASFNSFLPKHLPDSIGTKLVNAWVERLADNPHLHDKVEFEVATPSFRFDLEDFYRQFYPNVLNQAEFRRYLVDLSELTLSHVRDLDSLRMKASQAVDSLETWQTRTGDSQDCETSIWTALDMCRKYGTEPFVVHARHAFAAKSILMSLGNLGVLDSDYLDRLQAKMRTVAGEFALEVARASSLDSVDRLLETFGHLRPGTYEVSSLRYDEMPHDLFLHSTADEISALAVADEDLTAETYELERALREVRAGGWTAEELLRYFVTSTKERERAKFIFSRTLSDILCSVKTWASDRGLSREDASFLSLDAVLSGVKNVLTTGSHVSLEEEVTFGKRQYAVTKSLRLPALITEPDEIWVVPVLVSQPNFIGVDNVIAPLVVLDGSSLDLQTPLEGVVVAIESADPGFDWIFTKGLVGLITRFGGANSHMAIRCAELDIPAAIGCGEELFERLVGSYSVEIDGGHRIVRPVQ